MFFENPKFGTIHVLEDNGEIWFAAGGICRALGIADMKKALATLDDEDKCAIVANRRKTQFINEAGFYALAYSCRQPRAKAACRWITKGVIPAVVRHGRLERFISNPDTLIAILTAFKKERAKAKRLRKIIASQNRKIAKLKAEAEGRKNRDA